MTSLDLSYIAHNTLSGTPTKDPMLFQRLHDLWSDFARKFPFFFSVVHRKFKLENDFSFRLHTRTLFAFELPQETHLRIHVDLDRAKTTFGDKWSSPIVQQIFSGAQFNIQQLTAGEGGVVEMDAARALVKVNALPLLSTHLAAVFVTFGKAVSDAICTDASARSPTLKSTESSATALDNIPLFTIHVIFSTQGASVRSRSRRAMIQLLRREFIRMLVGVLDACLLPDAARDPCVASENLASVVERCWEADAIESQSSQESLWMKISLRLYNFIATLASNPQCVFHMSSSNEATSASFARTGMMQRKLPSSSTCGSKQIAMLRRSSIMQRLCNARSDKLVFSHSCSLFVILFKEAPQRG